MTAAARLSLAALNAMAQPEFVATLGDIFEHAPWIAQGAYAYRPFATVTALHRSMLAVLDAAAPETVVAFLDGHPDLAAPAARTAPLTQASAREQAGAGLDGLSAADASRLARWNRQYREKFGFPFIICAGRHNRSSIFAEFERRLHGDRQAEFHTALTEVAEITGLRLAARIAEHAGA